MSLVWFQPNFGGQFRLGFSFDWFNIQFLARLNVNFDLLFLWISFFRPISSVQVQFHPNFNQFFVNFWTIFFERILTIQTFNLLPILTHNLIQLQHQFKLNVHQFQPFQKQTNFSRFQNNFKPNANQFWSYQKANFAPFPNQMLTNFNHSVNQFKPNEDQFRPLHKPVQTKWWPISTTP